MSEGAWHDDLDPRRLPVYTSLHSTSRERERSHVDGKQQQQTLHPTSTTSAMRAPATPGTMAVPAAPDTADSTSSTQPSPHDPRGRCDEMRVRGIRTTGTTAHKPNGRQWAGDYVRRPLSLLCVMVTMLLLLLLGSLPSATAGTSPSPSSSNKGWESRFKSKTTKRTLFKSRPKSTRLGSGTDSSGGGGGLESSSASAGAGDGGSDSGSGSGTHVRHAFRGVHWSLRAPRIVATTATTSSSSSSSSTLFRHPVGSRWTHLSTFHVPLSSDFTSPVPTRAHARAQEEGIGNEDSEGSEDYAATLSTLFANMPRALHGQALSSRCGVLVVCQCPSPCSHVHVGTRLCVDNSFSPPSHPPHTPLIPPSHPPHFKAAAEG